MGALERLARFHEITMLAVRGRELTYSFPSFDWERSQMSEAARAWAREVSKARVEHPELPDPTDGAERMAEYWAKPGSGKDLEAMLGAMSGELAAIHAAAMLPFKAAPDSTLRFLLLYELYEAHRRDAPLGDGRLSREELPVMFCTDYPTVVRWLEWAEERSFVRVELQVRVRGAHVLLTRQGVDMMEGQLAEWKQEASS